MNVGEHVSRAARFHLWRTALIDGARRVSFAALEERTNRLAHALVARGIQRRDRVALVLPNSVEWIESDFAIAKAGAMTVPLAVRLHEREMAGMIEASQASLLITDVATLARLRSLIGAIAVLVVGAAGDEGYEAAMAGGSARHLCVEVDEASDGRVMRFTSGTTGKPKGVYLTHRNWLAIAHCHLLDRWSLQPDDVFLGTSPYSHAGGLWILPALMRGAAVNIYDKFEAETLLAEIEGGRASVVQLVPTALRRLLDLPGVADRKFEGLRAVHYGGAPIDGPMLAEALAVIGPKLVQGYGLNEAGIVCTLQAADHTKAIGQQGWLQPLGREVTMAEIVIADATGRAVADGEIGEITIRGPMVFPEYWRDPQATAVAIREGGFFWTGDLALRGANGYVYLAGRSKDIIVTGGFNVSPDEVESMVARHPAVHQCAVIGIADREWGEQVTAFVVVRPGMSLTAKELIDFCRDNLTGYKKPREVRFVTSLPVNSNGKVVRRMLREQVAQEKLD